MSPNYDKYCIPALLSLAATLVMLTVGVLSPAEAGWRRQPEDLSRGYVVAESRYGNGTVSGPVRMRRLGPQVRLPGGTWQWCRRTCAETLRVESIDFWDSRQDGVLTDECGIFGCLEIRGRY
ncbi:MAG: hypothetical protein RIC14_13910 [Filomicrobium sp.]